MKARFTVIVRAADGRLYLTRDVEPEAGEAAHQAPRRMLREARIAGGSFAAVFGASSRPLAEWAAEA